MRWYTPFRRKTSGRISCVGVQDIAYSKVLEHFSEKGEKEENTRKYIHERGNVK